MGSSVPYRSWRQKAAALALIGGSWLAWYHTEPSHQRPRLDPQPPAIERVEQPERGVATLEDVIASSYEHAELSDELGFKTADALASLSRDDLAAYERAGEALGIDPVLLTTISIIESDGGRVLYPRAFTSRGDHVPFGHHHVKPQDLSSVLEQARDARSFYGERLDLESLQEQGWNALTTYDSMPEDVRSDAESYFSSRSGAIRTHALAALIPENLPDSFDLTDAYESALAAGIMTIYSAAYLASHGFEVDERVLKLAYTGGPIGTRGALTTDHTVLGSEAFADIARSVSGNWGAWYVDAGGSIADHLRSYDSLAHAHDHAARTMRLARSAPEASDASIGALYTASRNDERLLYHVEASLAPRDGRADLNDLMRNR